MPKIELFNTYAIEGMSIRDYFAAKAMQSIILRDGEDALVVGDTVFTAYQYADAMINERNKNASEKAQ